MKISTLFFALTAALLRHAASPAVVDALGATDRPAPLRALEPDRPAADRSPAGRPAELRFSVLPPPLT